MPRQTVIEDYLLSASYRASSVAETMALFSDERFDAAGFAGDRDALRAQVRALVSVDADFLRAAFDAVDQRFGSFDSYVRSEDGLRLGDAEVSQLKKSLLE